MLLADKISDMSGEELFSIFKPFLFIVPLIIVIIVGVYCFKAYKKTAVKRMFMYMNTTGLAEKDKREYLAKYLQAGNQCCPVCAKKYSLKTEETNARGDKVEKWNYDGCPYCKTQVRRKTVDNYAYFYLERKPTNDAKEAKYAKTFEALNKLIDFYKPYIDCTPDASDDRISVEITFR
ncbi:MAG: hypothetical protein E7355_05285 [Clostridiales bacterium]|nr:hypothetical protein [Clostridiales bacterium]